ncbi:hypothetical protein A9F13_02g01078 [Clavispora lusitaniae]|uniref:Striatin N-terminal domain-containing protein n=1 Tax=Clavispora lusitaniae TaxID=36911 RepID=A0AA91T3V2_CLALS|nr:hypothetical protein A9F13_02g01078 [Clavispora lusitaniae]
MKAQANRKDSAEGASPQPQAQLANYTLPGVISYLTSEFTNLERFKIVTNLEKSEMRSRIDQLTAEINALRFLNEKQALRIRELEQERKKKTETNKIETEEEKGESKQNKGESKENKAENKEIKGENNDKDNKRDKRQSHGKLNNTNDDAITKEGRFDVENTKAGGYHKDSGLAANSGSSTSNSSSATLNGSQIPAIDLDVLRRARDGLHRSIQEAMCLLRPPASAARHYVPEGDLDDVLAPRRASPDFFDRYASGDADLLNSHRDSASFVGAVPLDSAPSSRRASTTSTTSDAATVIDSGDDIVDARTSAAGSLPLSVSVATTVPLSGDRVCAPVSNRFVVVGGSLTAYTGSTVVASVPADGADMVEAYHVGGQFLVVAAKGIYQYAAQTAKTCLLTFDSRVSVCAVAERDDSALVACAGEDAEGRPFVYVVQVSGGSARVTSRYDHAALGSAAPVTQLGWHDDDVVVVHSHLSVIRAGTAAAQKVFDGHVDAADIKADFALLRLQRSVVLFNLADSRVMATQHADDAAAYGLVVRGSPYVVYVDKKVHVLDMHFDEVAAGAAGGRLVSCAGDSVLLSTGSELRVVDLAWKGPV